MERRAFITIRLRRVNTEANKEIKAQ